MKSILPGTTVNYSHHVLNRILYNDLLQKIKAVNPDYCCKEKLWISTWPMSVPDGYILRLCIHPGEKDMARIPEILRDINTMMVTGDLSID